MNATASSTSARKRSGIAAAGNWIVDKVKIVDALPARGMLGSILSETQSTGGAPANVLACLAHLRTPFELTAVGVIGDDEAGAFIRQRFEALGVDTSRLVTLDNAATSYTDVMSEKGTGDRTFYHYRGANVRLGPEHIPAEQLDCRIFHLGYLMLLDHMDQPDEQFGTVAARVLHDLQQQGIRTSLDLVSEDSDRFQTIIPPALRYVDYLSLNEIEAGRTAGVTIRRSDQLLDTRALIAAAEALSQLGSMRYIAIHMPEGVFVRRADGSHFSLGSLALPDGYIEGTTGAGDAFCAGLLFGTHEDMPLEESVKLGICCAAACLSAGDASSGVRPLAEVRALADQYSFRDPPV